MKVIFGIALAVGISHFLNLPEKLSDLGEVSQRFCHEMLAADSVESATLSSLVCGEKVTDSEKRKWLRHTGLIHIFVVSGGHLIVLCEVFAFFRLHFIVQLLLLGLFSLATGFQAPCLRALFQLVLGRILKHYNLHFTRDQAVLLCGIFCLSLFPSWIKSLSFQLSWVAALALSLQVEKPEAKTLGVLFLKSFLIYVLLQPLLWRLGGQHPFSILWNMTLAPVIATGLFPLAIMACLNDQVLFIFESLMSLFWLLLSHLHSYSISESHWSLNHLMTWAYILLAQSLSHIILVQLRRRRRT